MGPAGGAAGGRRNPHPDSRSAGFRRKRRRSSCRADAGGENARARDAARRHRHGVAFPALAAGRERGRGRRGRSRRRRRRRRRPDGAPPSREREIPGPAFRRDGPARHAVHAAVAAAAGPLRRGRRRRVSADAGGDGVALPELVEPGQQARPLPGDEAALAAGSKTCAEFPPPELTAPTCFGRIRTFPG